MEYYHSKLVKNSSFQDVVDHVVKELGREGFGVLTEIDVQETMKHKLNIDFNTYKILGSVVDPISSMQAIANEELEIVALNTRQKLLDVLQNV